MNYRAALAWLYGTQRFGIKLGLESSHRLFDSLGVGRLPAKIFHVAGTNGKGSVCATIDAVARAEGYRTGLFTSPHLVTFRERIRLNGEMISEEAVAAGLTSIREKVASWDPHPTFFEITTALALLHFREVRPELIVLETGLGGRLDSTNATEPVVSVITPIDYDHQKWLGNSLAEIAGEKAGIIKAGIPVVSAAQAPAAAEVIRGRAAALGSPLTVVSQPYARFPVALRGSYQKENAALAVATFAAAGVPVRDEAIKQGLATVQWPARFQRWDSRTVIDGAHNPAGARSLASAWREEFVEERASVILATLSDKDVAGLVAALAPIAQRFVLPCIRSERALSPEELSLTIEGLSPAVPAAIVPSIAEAWQLAQQMKEPILVTGSLHFAGEALAFLQGQPAAYEECLQ